MKIFNKTKISLLIPIFISLNSLKCEDLNLKRDFVGDLTLKIGETKDVSYTHYGKSVNLFIGLDKIYFNNHENKNFANIYLITEGDTLHFKFYEGKEVRHKPLRDALGIRVFKLEHISGLETIGFRDDEAYFTLWDCDYCG